VLGAIPPEAYHSLPYLLTIIILAGVVGRSVPPAADGRPFAKEARA
jgi:simple sugar transport system permease protein